MYKWIISLFLVIAIPASTLAETAMPDTGPVLIGSDTAPRTVDIYFSPMCEHCARVYQLAVDDSKLTGKRGDLDQAFREGRFRLRLYPVYFGPLTDQKRSLWADMMARCSTDYQTAMLRLVSTQETWISGTGPKGELPEKVTEQAAITAMRGLVVPDLISADTFEACMQNSDLARGLVQAQSGYLESVKSVPSVRFQGEIYKTAPAVLKVLRHYGGVAE